nr:MFS transporter [Nitratireductor sp. OM-1]
MTLGVFGLVTAEFLPASLLTPMATDLGISEGMAGQAVTATALVGLVASLLISAATRSIDRRRVLLSFTVLLIVANLMVAFAPNLPVLLTGRVLLGIALGGFWAISAAVAMRLAPEALVPRALSMIVSGVAAATIVAAPLGSYVGEMWGWRSAFLLATVLGAITFVVQFATLPAMAPNAATRLRMLVDVLARTVPDQAESAGGLLVAAIQFAIAIGAAGGGLIFDVGGAQGVFSVSSVVLVQAAVMIFIRVRPQVVAAPA